MTELKLKILPDCFQVPKEPATDFMLTPPLLEVPAPTPGNLKAVWLGISMSDLKLTPETNSKDYEKYSHPDCLQVTQTPDMAKSTSSKSARPENERAVESFRTRSKTAV